jgi:flagellar basal body P-ring protein FlgI
MPSRRDGGHGGHRGPRRGLLRHPRRPDRRAHRQRRIIEREVPYTFAGRQTIRLLLRNPDLTTARRIATAINRSTGGSTAIANDPRTVTVQTGGRDAVGFAAEIEQLRVEPDQWRAS